MKLSFKRTWAVLVVACILIGPPLAVLMYQSHKTGMTWAQVIRRMTTRAANTQTGLERVESDILPKGEKIDFLTSQLVGRKFTQKDAPRISNVAVADLDQDGLLDVVVCDCQTNEVSWIRQYPRGVYTEHVLASNLVAPARVQVVDFDKDGDLDLVVAVLGMLFPNNDKIGSVVVLENVGDMKFTPHVAADRIARVSDARAGDLDGDGDMDLAVVQFGYDDGETRWVENLGNWQFKSHILQTLSGPINVEIADIDKDGDMDLITLVSQEWEEIYAFINDGKGNFAPKLLNGSSNEDFGSSGISLCDFDQDGDLDILYTNGDAFDYIPPRPRPWHGVQWLENQGNLNFKFRRVADFAGAYNARGVDFDHDGDLDLVACSSFNFWEKPEAMSLVWLENDGHQHFRMHDIANNPTHILALELGDFNGDGEMDLVTGGMHVYPPFDRMARIAIWTNHRPETVGKKPSLRPQTQPAQ